MWDCLRLQHASDARQAHPDSQRFHNVAVLVKINFQQQDVRILVAQLTELQSTVLTIQVLLISWDRSGKNTGQHAHRWQEKNKHDARTCTKL